MKRKKLISIVLILFIIVISLSSCSGNTDIPIVSATPSPIAVSIPPECTSYQEIDGAYCGYSKKDLEDIKIDREIKGTSILYKGDYSYLELEAFKALEESYIMPVQRDMCALCSDVSIGQYGYAGAWCDCEKLSDEQYYYDIEEMLEIFRIDGPLKDTDVKIYPTQYDSDVGIAYEKTMLYEIMSGNYDFLPIPSSYADIYFIDFEGEYDKERIEKMIIDTNGRNHIIQVITIDTKDAIYLEFTNTNNGSYRMLAYALKE